MISNIAKIRPVLRQVTYGDKDATLWHRRWRLFFLATAGLFGHRNGDGMGRQPLPAEAHSLKFFTATSRTAPRFRPLAGLRTGFEPIRDPGAVTLA